MSSDKKDQFIFIRAISSDYVLFKRLLDIFASTVGLLITLPIFLITALAIKIDSPGPIFFKQRRTGRWGKEFDLIKFRSMVRENNVHDFTCEDKYTGVGHFIRKTSIDELPQLLNVLKGDMSIVGPRPWIPDYYENMTPRQRHKYDVRPGITGLAQVNGRNALSVLERIDYDLLYVSNFSFRQDIKVLLQTARAVLQPRVGEDATTKLGIHDDIDDLIWDREYGYGAKAKPIVLIPGDDFVKNGEVQIIDSPDEVDISCMPKQAKNKTK